MNMAKLKPLLPTLREKKRYLAFEVISGEVIPWKEIKGSVSSAIADHIGRLGLASAGLIFVKNNKNKVVLRVSHTMLTQVRQALMFIKQIHGRPVIVQSITASGMLHKAAKAVA